MVWSSIGYIEDGPRTNFGCVNINSRKIMVIGGKLGLVGLKRCDFWDFETKKWSVGPSIPIQMKYCRATLLNGYIYVIGTYTEFYRLKIDQMEAGWQRLPPAKVDGLGCELVSDEKYVYRIGDNFKRTSMHRYDPIRHIWQSLPEMEVGRDFLGADVVNGKIYVTGGRTGFSGDKVLSSVSIYDISRKKWRLGPELPVMMHNHSAVAVGKYILVSGGQKRYGSRSSSSCYVLNTEIPEWTKLESQLPQGFSGHSSISSGWNVTLIGGVGSTENLDLDKRIITTNLLNLLPQKKRRNSDSTSSTCTSFLTEKSNGRRADTFRRGRLERLKRISTRMLS